MSLKIKPIFVLSDYSGLTHNRLIDIVGHALASVESVSTYPLPKLLVTSLADFYPYRLYWR